MRVFISWSGDRSLRVAELLDTWLRCVIQAVDPWLSSKDIDRGSVWFNQISTQLANTSIGIICLTLENRSRPWILFEAGSLAKGLSTSQVCTFLIDLEPADIENPLAQFNHTKPDKNGLLGLIRSINNSFPERPLQDSVLVEVFDTYWPKFELQFENILRDTQTSEKVEKRNSDEILLEVLSSVRTLNKRMRDLEARESQETKRFERPKSDLKDFDILGFEKYVSDSLIEGVPADSIIIGASNLFGVSSSLTKSVISKVRHDREFNLNER